MISMDEKIPRRLRRFHRRKGSQTKKTEKGKEDIIEQMQDFSGKKQKDFNKKLKIEKKKPDNVAEQLYDQMKKKEERKKARDKRQKDSEKNKGKETKTKKGETPTWQKRREERLKGIPAQTPEQKTGKKKEETKGIPPLEQPPAFEKSQVAKTEKKGRRGRRGKKEEETKSVLEETPETSMKGTEIKDLFGGTEKTSLNNDKMDEELKLDLNLDGELSEDEEIKHPKEEEKGSCPNCKKSFNELVFCSKCGDAFCDNCAKIKQKTDKGTKYVCPNCGHVTKK